ncbi:hypothetical protein DOTSEDRAFT_22423 [Dothistroma septosporum NZE10]|uniref:protein-tyrosine-phosphatase n=1 Tax=Dothistroma septosporum (strain NZE10 / CBS 128990) TaxID=675120 RepID=N1PVA6_DOTSN|nr:hypothetical protein DOTSEDRAFT_22423 [Dothistroma septosporum NZE10]
MTLLGRDDADEVYASTFRPSLIARFDYVLAMDEDNFIDLRDSVKRARKSGKLDDEALQKVYMFGEFGGKDKREPIVDPWYDGGRKGFEVAYEQVFRMGTGLLRQIEAEAKKEKSELES